MKKYGWPAILTALILAFGCIGFVHAEIIPPCEPGQQIGYPAVVLCEKLTLREKPSSSSKAIETLEYGYTPIVIKQSVSGCATADKKLVQNFVKMLLGMEDIPKPDHAADALAAAITHINIRRV